MADEQTLPPRILNKLASRGNNDGDKIFINIAPIVPRIGSNTIGVAMLIVETDLRIIVPPGTATVADTIFFQEPEGPRTAILLVVGDGSAPSLTLYLRETPPDIVRWRLAGGLYNGLIRDYVDIAMDRTSGPITLPAVAKGDFQVVMAAGANTPLTFTPTGEEIQHAIIERYDATETTVAYHWRNPVDQDAVDIVVDGGPWFFTEFAIDFNFDSPWVGSDTFWAPPSCGQVADVMIINNNELADYWDQPGTGEQAMADPTTLLLNHVDDHGTRWIVTDIEGWWTLPPVELPELKRSGNLDGSFPVDGRYDARVITLTGEFWPRPDTSPAVPRLKLLRALDAVRGGALLVVKEPTWTKQAWVWLSDQPKITNEGTANRMGFDVQLRAVDPIKYHGGIEGLRVADVTVTAMLIDRYYEPPDRRRYDPVTKREYQDDVAGTRVGAFNSGTANVLPRIFIYGPCQNPEVTNIATGQVMSYEGFVAEGQCLITDCYWRTVVIRDASDVVIAEGAKNDYLGTNERHMLRWYSPWMHIAPNLNAITFRAASPGESTKCMVAFRSGWMGS